VNGGRPNGISVVSDKGVKLEQSCLVGVCEPLPGPTDATLDLVISVEAGSGGEGVWVGLRLGPNLILFCPGSSAIRVDGEGGFSPTMMPFSVAPEQLHRLEVVWRRAKNDMLLRLRDGGGAGTYEKSFRPPRPPIDRNNMIEPNFVVCECVRGEAEDGDELNTHFMGVCRVGCALRQL
jgi:hypothetical protein